MMNYIIRASPCLSRYFVDFEEQWESVNPGSHIKTASPPNVTWDGV